MKIKVTVQVGDRQINIPMESGYDKLQTAAMDILRQRFLIHDDIAYNIDGNYCSVVTIAMVKEGQ